MHPYSESGGPVPRATLSDERQRGVPGLSTKAPRSVRL